MAQVRRLCIVVLGMLAITGCASTNRFSGHEITPALPSPECLLAAQVQDAQAPAPASLPTIPTPQPDDRPLPINLPTALQLANVRAVDIATAAERIRVAAAVLEQAQVLWLPTITIGGDYARHDGQNQDIQGNIFNNSSNRLMFGLGTGIGSAAVLNVDEAIFAPLIARQQLRVREADRQAAMNDTLVAVTDAYFNVEQARGELAGAAETTRRTEELVRRTKKLAPGLVPELEVDRAEAELVRRQQAEVLARERWKVASAELLRVLRLDPAAQVAPLEPPHLRVELIDLSKPVDDLIPIALTYRPELASQQAQVQATLALLKQERLRPLIPSVLLRGFSTPVTGTLAAGVFGGGPNGTTGNFGLRSDLDLQLLWQLDNLGFGNWGRIRQRESENNLAVVNLSGVQARIAAEVAQAYAQAQLARRRVEMAAKGVQSALSSAEKNLVALGQTKGGGNQVTLLVRPQEAVASVQALAQAYIDYYGAVADANRAQFRLYRALGQPAQCVIQDQHSPSIAVPEGASPPTPRGAEVEALPAPRPLPADGERGGNRNAPR